MLGRQVKLIDIDPEGYLNFSRTFPRLSRISPQAVLWHEEGIPRRMLIGERERPVSVSHIADARITAKAVYESFRGKVRRVVVTDLEGYDRIYAAQNQLPEPDEEKYHYLARMNRALIAQFDERVAIYPETSLDRGPVALESVRSFMSEKLPEQSSLIFAVFDNQELYFSFVVRVRSGEADLVTSFDHWEALIGQSSFSSEGLDRTVEVVGEEFGPVACALFMERRDFERLYDGRRHARLPASLILASRAFGYSSLPGVAETAFLNTAGLFAYVPVYIP